MLSTVFIVYFALWTGGRITSETIVKNTESTEETVVTMQYAKVVTKSNEEKSFMSAALLQGRDEESQLENTCKNLAAGDCIFLLTFNLLYMLCDCKLA